jgi:metallo-beta-lactamase class B
MFARLALAALALLSLGATKPVDRPGASKDIAGACGAKDGWADPAPPAHVFGNTWYVGTCGITVVLIETKAGLVLIDSGPLNAKPHVLASIRALGFDPMQIKWLLTTHEHFDHGGGIAAIQAETGANLAAGPFAAGALRSGKHYPEDPQAALLEKYPMAPARVDRVIRDRGSLDFGGVRFTAHSTPVHTSGSTSWTWRTCESGACKTIALLDSSNTISAPGYRFTDNKPRTDAARSGLIRMASLPCDILLTPHPQQSDLLVRLSGKAPMLDRNACQAYVEAGRKRLSVRLWEEAGKP